MIKKDLEGCRKIMKVELIPAVEEKLAKQVASAINQSIANANAGILREKKECERLFGKQLKN